VPVCYASKKVNEFIKRRGLKLLYWLRNSADRKSNNNILKMLKDKVNKGAV